MKTDYTNNKVEKSWVMFLGGSTRDIVPVRLRKIELDHSELTMARLGTKNLVNTKE